MGRLMKTINTYINEKLRLNAKPQYTCQPVDEIELQRIIIERIKTEGPKCDLNDIDVSKITNMSFLFSGQFNNKPFKNFNGDISLWDMSNVTQAINMFHSCKKFNCDISGWNVSNIECMNSMFYGCEKFNQDLNKWDVSNVKYMKNAFKGCPTTPTWYDIYKWEK